MFRMFQKERSLELILSRIIWIREVRRRHYDTCWKPWFEEGRKTGDFKGTARDGDLNVITFSEYGYHCERPDSYYSKIKAADLTDLPLMINDPYFEESKSKTLIEKRLKGEVDGFPLRQDLLDKYEHYEHFSNLLYRVFGYYQELLFREVQSKFKDQIYRKHGGHTQLIVLECKGHLFYIDYSGNGMKLLGQEDVLTHKIWGLTNDKLPTVN